jgi:hypothetical protein
MVEKNGGQEYLNAPTVMAREGKWCLVRNIDRSVKIVSISSETFRGGRLAPAKDKEDLLQKLKDANRKKTPVAFERVSGLRKSQTLIARTREGCGYSITKTELMFVLRQHKILSVKNWGYHRLTI